MTITDDYERKAAVEPLPYNKTAGSRTQILAVTGGLVGSMAAMACCIMPLALIGLGVSGAWIGNLTRLAPYQPYFMAGAVACLGFGYWLVRRSRKQACAGSQACARPLPNRLVMAGLVLGAIFIAAELAFNAAAPLFL